MLIHLFQDIRAKGVTRNYNTKPNEKMHSPLKKAYRTRTNFKDVANQVRRMIVAQPDSYSNTTSLDTQIRPLGLRFGTTSTTVR